MRFLDLAARGFRNLSADVVSFGPGVNLVLGENGQGKTNLLEAAALVCGQRSFRRATPPQMAADGERFAVSGTIRRGFATEELAVEWSRGEGRKFRRAGKEISFREASALAPAVFLAPEHRSIVVGPPEERRRFLDRLVIAIHPAHGTHSARYEAAMRARNALLADDRPADPEWLSALEAQMDAHGAAIDAARRDVMGHLNRLNRQTPPGPFALPSLSLEGWASAAEPLAPLLRASRARDAAAGRALAGPHRADLVVTHAAKGQLAALCSTGEQKALLLSLILAHAAIVGTESGRPLVILLDEVAAHLDPSRRQALFERLRATGGQIWMTGTEAALFEGLDDAARFMLRDGTIHAA